MSETNITLFWKGFISSGKNYRREKIIFNGFVEETTKTKKVHLSDEK
jgi:hypothetical protein